MRLHIDFKCPFKKSITRKLCYRNDDCAMRPTYECLSSLHRVGLESSSTVSSHATSSLRKISPCFLGVGGWATKSEGVGLSEGVVHAISFQDFQPMWSQSTNVTDRGTYRRMTCNRKTAINNIDLISGWRTACNKPWNYISTIIEWINKSMNE